LTFQPRLFEQFAGPKGAFEIIQQEASQFLPAEARAAVHRIDGVAIIGGEVGIVMRSAVRRGAALEGQYPF